MNKDFLDYYHQELVFIREMGAEFARANPGVARRLQLEDNRCGDPHVERLLEAFAFLTARVRKKIDDEYPEISDALLSVLYPHYQRPIPSMAVVQFVGTYESTKMAGRREIRRGTELTTRPVDGLPCRFRTAYPAELWPVAVEGAALARDRVAIPGKPEGSTALLRLTLRCTSEGDWAALEGFDRLRFFLEGEEPVPSSLYESLFNNLAGVRVQQKTASGEVKTVVLPSDAVRPVGFGPDECMVPYPARSFPGYRLLQEFFAFPAKFLFFDLNGLGRLGAAGMSGPVDVLFFLKQPPKADLVIRPDNFRLACAPVVNLFETASEPIRVNQLQTHYPVVVKYGDPMGYEVYAVDRVVSNGSYLEDSYELQPFYAIRHGSPGPRREAYWYLSRRPSLREKVKGVKDKGTEVELAFTDPHFKPTSPPVETLTAFMTCTNRDLPVDLPFGGEHADFQLESDAPVGRVRLLTQPTAPLRAPLGRSAQWRLISQLGLNHLSLVETEQGPEALRELLTIYDFSGDDYTGSDETRKMIAGVIGVSARRIAGRLDLDGEPNPVSPLVSANPGRNGAKPRRRMGQGLCLGVEVTVKFDEDQFPGARAFLMACVLERFFGAYVTINSFTQMVAASKQREKEWKRWQPRCGDRTLL